MTLKMLRVSKNWNQETAAKKLKISVSKLSNWENAKTFPDAMKLSHRKISKVFTMLKTKMSETR
ncbi:TPA: helix-turn-helix transcriptional regulator [Streptococcus pyogenes]|nr:helix-turn-helix transcriptional regulator [Streptococcus pyogenes]